MGSIRRIAINAGGGYVPGLDLVVSAVARAAARQGWDAVVIRDGFDGLLEPGRFGGAGVVPAAHQPPGTGARIDPFKARSLDADGFVSEVDRSDELLAALDAAGIDAVISIVGGSAVTGIHAASVALKLSRKGLRCVAIPKSVENDITGIALPLGADSALNEAVRLLSGITTGAREAGRVAVVVLPGSQSGWLALQAGLALQADAVVIPELPGDPETLAAALPASATLVVVASGARFPAHAASSADPMRASLSPLSDPAQPGGLVTAGRAAITLATAIQRHSGREALAFTPDQMIRGGSASALDRELAAAYGVAAVEALASGTAGSMLSFAPPKMEALPLAATLGGPRVVPLDGALIRAARGLGIVMEG